MLLTFLPYMFASCNGSPIARTGKLACNASLIWTIYRNLYSGAAWVIHVVEGIKMLSAMTQLPEVWYPVRDVKAEQIHCGSMLLAKILFIAIG